MTYATESKTAVLGVPAELIAEHGVVSAEVAREMAERARKLFCSDFAVSTTCLAGPDGDGVNPVGTVFVALATAEGCVVNRLKSGFGRSRVRTLASNTALDMVRRHLTKLPVLVDYHKNFQKLG